MLQLPVVQNFEYGILYFIWFRNLYLPLFYRCTVHFEIYVFHTPTNALFINLVKFLNLH